MRSYPVPLLALVLVLVALSGCLDDADPKTPDLVPDFVDPMAFREGHDHGDRAQHQITWNLKELGWSPLADIPVAWAEISTHPSHDIGLVAFAWPTAGFATVDLSNASSPELMAVHDLGYGYGADVKWDPTGTWAILGVQAHSTRGLPTVGPAAVPDPLAMTKESGIELYHVTETGEIHGPYNGIPAPSAGVHMLYTHRIADKDYLFTAWNGRGVGVYEIVDGMEPAGGKRLVPVTAVMNVIAQNAAAAPTSLGLSGAHDMTVIDDPILKKPLLYVADGYRGLTVYDVSDPTDKEWPNQPLGHWVDPAGAWYMHTVQAEVLDDGTRRIVLAPEVFSDAEALVVAPLWILDGTDLGDIQLLATWKNPGDHGAEELRFSVHNFQLVDGRIALAHYHGGVWLLDVTTDGTNTTVTPIGYHLPANDPMREMSGIYHGVYNMEDAPTIWDVVVHKGVLWASDVNSGIYAIASPDWTVGDASVMSLG